MIARRDGVGQLPAGSVAGMGETVAGERHGEGREPAGQPERPQVAAEIRARPPGHQPAHWSTHVSLPVPEFAMASMTDAVAHYHCR